MKENRSRLDPFLYKLFIRPEATATNQMHHNNFEACENKCCSFFLWGLFQSQFLTYYLMKQCLYVYKILSAFRIFKNSSAIHLVKKKSVPIMHVYDGNTHSVCSKVWFYRFYETW